MLLPGESLVPVLVLTQVLNAALLKFLAEQADHYRAHPDEARKFLHVGPAELPADEARLAAWTSVCRALLNLHETITRY